MSRERGLTKVKEYDGQLNFATDAWTSPNHMAFVALTVHLERNGKPLSMVLDVVEVAKVFTHLKFEMLDG
jgi:hypothetical protein